MGLLGFNQYLAEDKVFCSRKQHSASSEAWSLNLSISSQVLYRWATALLMHSVIIRLNMARSVTSAQVKHSTWSEHTGHTLPSVINILLLFWSTHADSPFVTFLMTHVLSRSHQAHRVSNIQARQLVCLLQLPSLKGSRNSGENVWNIFLKLLPERKISYKTYNRTSFRQSPCPYSTNYDCSRRQILWHLYRFSNKLRYEISWGSSASRRFSWNMPYLLFLKKHQNLKL